MIERIEDLRIVGIGGSLREHSCSYIALEHAMALLARMGCHARTLDLRKMPLPFCNGEKHELWPGYPGVAQLRKAVSGAHALVLVTPEYHGGMSGVLKNALDLLDVAHLEGKVVGGISVLGGPANSNALNDLGRVMRWCHAWVIPQQIAVGRASTVFVNGQIADEGLQRRFEQFARSLVWSATRLGDLQGPDARATQRGMAILAMSSNVESLGPRERAL
jgi:FMN reductase